MPVIERFRIEYRANICNPIIQTVPSRRPASLIKTRPNTYSKSTCVGHVGFWSLARINHETHIQSVPHVSQSEEALVEKVKKDTRQGENPSKAPKRGKKGRNRQLSLFFQVFQFVVSARDFSVFCRVNVYIGWSCIDKYLRCAALCQ